MLSSADRTTVQSPSGHNGAIARLLARVAPAVRARSVAALEQFAHELACASLVACIMADSLRQDVIDAYRWGRMFAGHGR